MSPLQIEQALSGDATALANLLSTLRPPVECEVRFVLRRYATPRGRDPKQEVPDFVQAVFIALLADEGRVLRTWDPKKGRSLTSFVRLVTRRQVSSTMRNQRVNPWRDDPMHDGELEALSLRRSAPQHAESRRMLDQVLERLHARLNQRGATLFKMIFVHECSVEEVQDQFGMSRDAVYAWRSRIRKIAREVAEVGSA